MNNLKQKLKNGECVTGTMVMFFDHPEIAKILKVCGFDFFIIDCEHGSFDYSAVGAVLTVAREAGIPGFVRVPEAKREVVLKYMEMGAQGLLLPSTETVEQAKALVEYSKYYPLGNRGVSLMRSHTGFARPSSAAEYMKTANEETMLMLQIESPKGVENIDDLLAVEGIDAAFIGPNDLSQSMGIMGQTSDPRFIAAVDKVIDSAKRNNKFSGIHLSSAEALKPWMEKGMSLNLLTSEINMIMDAGTSCLKKLKEI